MTSPIYTIQYLEDSPGLDQIDHKSVINKLRSAVERLPITHLLIGWHLPPSLLDACRVEAERYGMRFLRWQPLLAGDKDLRPDPSWYVEGLTGGKVPGYQGRPEFTFFCPNHPSVNEAVLEHLASIMRTGLYQGFFLDRVRFPSPAINLLTDLACFCDHCKRKAADQGIDLEEVRQLLIQQLKTDGDQISVVTELLSGDHDDSSRQENLLISQFLGFRQKSIDDFLIHIAQLIRGAQLEIGLDCFSPCLTRMVGQNLHTWGQSADWIKLMTYAHTLAPAGLPYELTGIARSLINHYHLSEAHTLEIISHASGLPLDNSCNQLERRGLSSQALQLEVKRGVDAASAPVLAGIELVDLPGVTNLDPNQIQADMTAVKLASPAGLAISWDLLHISLEKLKLAYQSYFW